MICVIGGGASGMMAAAAAAGIGKKVTIIEPNDRLGKKMLISGKGRCNLTNNCDIDGLFKNVVSNPNFLYSAFYTFTNQSVMAFFEGLGVALKTERGGRVFPQSDKAADVVGAFEKRLRDLKVAIVRDRAVGIVTQNGAVRAVSGEKGDYPCKSALIACGGKSYPKTGSTGDGFNLAKTLGHSVTPLRPFLVPLVTREDTSRLMGLTLKNVSLFLFDPTGKKLFEGFGELLFTHFGLSGPLALSASCHIKEAKGCKAVVDLKPALDFDALDKRLLRDFGENANRDFINSLGALLPVKLIEDVVKKSGIPPGKKVNSVTRRERETLARTLKGFDFTVKCLRPISEAIVTSGGVKTTEINPSTMESKIVKGLYFSGETIDVDAYTGGFNLQIAFSTGFLAGINMLEE